MASPLRILCSAPRSRPGDRSGRPNSVDEQVRQPTGELSPDRARVENRQLHLHCARLRATNVPTEAEDRLLMPRGRESLWPRSHLSSHFRVMLPRAGSARLGEWMSAERSPGAETLSMGIAARSLRSTGSTWRCSGEAFGLLGPNGRGGRDVGLLTPPILPTRGSAPVARSSGGCWRRTKVEAVGRNRRGALTRRAGGRDGSGLIRTGFGRRPHVVGASRQPLPVAPGDVPVITGRSATPAHIGARRHVSETLRAQSRNAVGGILSPAGRRPSRMRIP
jgi:hypothetical protein